jgi:hypothetical protein
VLSNAVALVATCKDPNGLHVTLRRAGKYIEQQLCLLAHKRRGKTVSKGEAWVYICMVW